MYVKGPWVEYNWPICDIYDFSKLNIRDGRIHYRLYQQDGSMVEMTCADTPDNRRVVSWIQIHDRRDPNAGRSASGKPVEKGATE